MPQNLIDPFAADALVLLKLWRSVDRAAIADKSNDSLQRAEYNWRKRLRTAADALLHEVHS